MGVRVGVLFWVSLYQEDAYLTNVLNLSKGHQHYANVNTFYLCELMYMY